MLKCPRCHNPLSNMPNKCPICGANLRYRKVVRKPPEVPLNKEVDFIPPVSQAVKDIETKSLPVTKEPVPVIEKKEIIEIPTSKIEAPLEEENAPKVSKEERIRYSKLHTNRGPIKFFLFSLITFGIYAIVYYASYSKELNRIRQFHGDARRMGVIGAFFLSIITLGIPFLVWHIRRAIDTYKYARRYHVSVGGPVFYLLSTLIVLSWTVVCPIIASIFIMKTMNRLCRKINKIVLGEEE